MLYFKVFLAIFVSINILIARYVINIKKNKRNIKSQITPTEERNREKIN